MKNGRKTSKTFFVETVNGLWLKGNVDLTEGLFRLYWQRRVEFDRFGTAKCIDGNGAVYERYDVRSGKIFDGDAWVCYAEKSIDLLPRIDGSYSLLDYYNMLVLHGLSCTVEGIGDKIEDIMFLYDDVSLLQFLDMGTEYVITEYGGHLAGCYASYVDDGEDRHLKVEIGDEEHVVALDNWFDYVMWLSPRIVEN